MFTENWQEVPFTLARYGAVAALAGYGERMILFFRNANDLLNLFCAEVGQSKIFKSSSPVKIMDTSKGFF